MPQIINQTLLLSVPQKTWRNHENFRKTEVLQIWFSLGKRESDLILQNFRNNTKK